MVIASCAICGRDLKSNENIMYAKHYTNFIVGTQLCMSCYLRFEKPLQKAVSELKGELNAEHEKDLS